MVGTDLQSVVHRLHRLAAEDAACAPDVELLRRFVAKRDATAFELLVWRHGAMVLAACRRILGRGPDAEDAFQATFLALVRQARSIRQSDSLGPWLHRVARRASLHAQRQIHRRKQIETSLTPPAYAPTPESPELRQVVDAEVDRLPERLRRAVVLCYLEGHTTEDAARLLGIPKGTILSRLSRARERLRARFLRRGLACASGALPVLADDALAATAVEAIVQNALNLTNGTAMAPAVAALTEGVVRSMFLSKFKLAAGGLLLAAAIVGTGGVLVTQPGVNAQPPKTEKAGGQKPKPSGTQSPFESLLAKDKTKPTDDLKRLQGSWNVDAVTVDGANDKAVKMRWTFGPSTMQVIENDKLDVTMSWHADPGIEPKTIDFAVGDKKMAGIYKFDATTLVVCMDEQRRSRPKEFDASKGSGHILFVLSPIADEKPARAGADGNDLEALKRENERLMQLLTVYANKEKQLQAMAAEMEQLARQQRDEAMVGRKQAEDFRNQADAQMQLAKAERDRAMAEMHSIQAKYERALKEQASEIDALRSKMPVEKWDASWSEIMIQMSDGSWGLRILADGSGIYGFGTKFDEFCTFAAGTFDFHKVRRDLLAGAKLDRTSLGIRADFRRKTERGVMTTYTEDAAFVIGLLRTAHDKATTANLEIYWKNSPPKAPVPATMSSGGAKP